MKICYLGTFDLDYLRNRIIRKGLQKRGIQIELCHTQYSNLLKVYIDLCLKWIKLYKKDIKAIIVGETGYILMPLAWIISKLWNKKLILDAFFSLYDTYVCDRKIVKKCSLQAQKLFLLDILGCKLADLILLDTQTHIEYFKRKFLLHKKDFIKIYVGGDDTVFYPRTINKSINKFIVLYWGTFIPLHGVEYVIESAKMLNRYEDIMFLFVGSGQTYSQAVKLATLFKLKNVKFLVYENEIKLTEIISQADVCLGIFGNTEKAKRVIPHKVYEAIAMKKPVLTGDTPAIKEVFEDRENILLCEMANPVSIAEKILELKNNLSLREKIAENGYRLFLERFTPEKTVEELAKYVNY